MTKESKAPPPGICLPWDERRKDLPPAKGDEALFQKIWEDNESLAYMYIWHLLVSF